MATKRNISSNEPENKPVIDEAVARNWEIPDFTIKEIRDAIPSHCFRRDTFRSFTYVIHDFAIIAVLGYLATYIDQVHSAALRLLLWSLYWTAQGIVGTGVWVVGHECGHQAFSPSKVRLINSILLNLLNQFVQAVNNSVGFVLHTLLLVPYHSWRFSHSRHHKATGHMSKDQVCYTNKLKTNPNLFHRFSFPRQEKRLVYHLATKTLKLMVLMMFLTKHLLLYFTVCFLCSCLAGHYTFSPMSPVKITLAGPLTSTHPATFTKRANIGMSSVPLLVLLAW